MDNVNIEQLDSSLFTFAQDEVKLSDTKMNTKRIGYLKDALIRFARNKASIVAAVIISILFLYAIFGPLIGRTNYTEIRDDVTIQKYAKLLPKIPGANGFWDGCEDVDVSFLTYQRYYAYGYELNRPVVTKVNSQYVNSGVTYVNVHRDSYALLGIISMTLTSEEYQSIQKFQDEHEVQIIYPMTDATYFNKYKNAKGGKYRLLLDNKNIWYECDENGKPELKDGKYVDIYRKNAYDEYTSKMRIHGDDGTFSYAKAAGVSDWEVRISLYDYFQYKYGYQPYFIFGSDGSGYDIFTRLASGARLSFILAISVALINFIIGAIWGAISGYYGGLVDLIMERISDILGGLPMTVITALFQLHLAQKVGAFPSLLFAFVLTGWLGTAGLLRMQFYRYKNQEYVLAARTLGASDVRLMFKHIFPNALGTIITSSVLVIPGVIFSESSLTYLGIVNLESDAMTSVGTMLANGRIYLKTFPHIILFPALFISLLMITFNLFGNGLRDAFNPSLRGAEE